MTHSIMNYDRRRQDWLAELNRGEREMFWVKFILWVFIFLLGATLANSLIPVSNAAEEKDTYIDDTFICTHIHEYPIEQHKAITDYCIDLAKRGL